MDFPIVILSMLSEDLVFFQDSDISWNGKHHAIIGLQVTQPNVATLASVAADNGFDDINDLLNYFVGFLMGAESDEALRVPRSRIASALHPIIREGDLTGITFANLAAYNKALMVRNNEPDQYAVAYDGRLAKGIPCFFDLACRLLWDLRQNMKSMRGAPFHVSFVQARNFDLDGLIRGEVIAVTGAQQNSVAVTVTEAPRISLGADSDLPKAKTRAARQKKG